MRRVKSSPDWSPRFWSHVRTRRQAISTELPVWSRFSDWEETCAPSYCHPNLLAAWTSWLRLFEAAALARHCNATPPVLDFGSSLGELGHLLDPEWPYHFVEQEEAAATFLLRSLPGAARTTLEDAPSGHFGCIFALDSLEHNEDYAEILALLASKLSKRGVLILSGPTENRLYRLGRRVAGFNSHYHVTTIADIESAAMKNMALEHCVTVPWGIPLFRISAWRLAPGSD